jgi:hypothetical protein
MYNTKFSKRAWLCAALFVMSVGHASAQDGAVSEQQGQISKYVNGGIGDTGILYMRSIANQWPVRITFSQLKANEFIANVQLLVTDSNNKTFLQIDGAGPMTYVQLPPGTYYLTATSAGQSQKRSIVVVGKNTQDVYFHWKGEAQNDPFDGKPLGGKQVPS